MLARVCERIEFVKAEQNMTKSKTAGFSLDIIAVATAIYLCCCYNLLFLLGLLLLLLDHHHLFVIYHVV